MVFYHRDRFGKRFSMLLPVSIVLHLLVFGVLGVFLYPDRILPQSLHRAGEVKLLSVHEPPEPPPLDPIRDRIAALTLEQKVGQMLMGSFAGSTGVAGYPLIDDLHVGGVVLFRDNLLSASQASSMIEQLQERARTGEGVGLFVATDHEGGKVAHLSPHLMERGPSAQHYGRTYNLEGLRGQARETAATFRSVGLTMNLAPVVDVRTNPDNEVIGSRSFGADARRVGDLSTAYIRELQAHGIIATAKHFPGHGPTSADSHTELPYAETLTERDLQVHLAPFVRAIEAGVGAIMTAHVVYPVLDNRPATLSPMMLQTILRDEMRYDGVIISDDLRMGSIESNFAWEEAVLRTVEAGTDVLLISGGRDRVQQTRDLLLVSVRTGDLPEERIDASLYRILTLKRQYGMLPERAGGLLALVY